MRSLILIILLSNTWLNLQSQTDSLSAKPHRYELGVNVTTILSNVLSNEVNEELRDFPVSLKIVSEKRIWRFALDANYTKGDNFPVDAQSLSLAFRVGLEKRNQLSERWRFLYGMDLQSRYFDERSTSAVEFEAIRLHDRSIGLGLSALFGFQFDISKRVALEIESSVLFLAFKEKSELEFSSSSSLNQVDNGYSYSLNMPDPRFLYLIIKF